MATRTVQARPIPAERTDETIQMEVDDASTVFAVPLEDRVAPRQDWERRLREDISTPARLTSNGLDVNGSTS